MMIQNENRIRILSIDGRELNKVLTNPLIPGMLLIVLRGLRIRTTLIAEIFESLNFKDSQPRITTEKSS